MMKPKKPAIIQAAKEREEREAASLRDNLRRRKEQQRARLAAQNDKSKTEGK